MWILFLSLACVVSASPLVVGYCNVSDTSGLFHYFDSNKTIVVGDMCLAVSGLINSDPAVLSVPCEAGNVSQAWIWHGNNTVESIVLPGMCWDEFDRRTDIGNFVVFVRSPDSLVRTQVALCVTTSAVATSPQYILVETDCADPSTSAYQLQFLWNTTTGTIVDQNGLCMGGAFTQTNYIRGQPCVSGAPTQQWMWESTAGFVVSVFDPSLCWDATNGDTVPGTVVTAYFCDSTKRNQRFYLQPDGSIRVLDAMCLTTSEVLASPQQLVMQYCNASLPAANFSFLTQTRTIVDGNGRCLGGAFDEFNAVRAQTCLSNATSQQWNWRPDDRIESIVSPGLCWNVKDFGTAIGTIIQLYRCSASGGEFFSHSLDGAIVSLYPKPIAGFQSRRCLATASVPRPWYLSLHWESVSAPTSNILSAPLRLWSRACYLFAYAPTMQGDAVSLRTTLAPPDWTATWAPTPLSKLRRVAQSDPLPFDAAGYTDFIPWRDLEDQDARSILYAVSLSTGSLFGSKDDAATWRYMSRLPPNASLANGRLYGVDDYRSGSFPYLVFYTSSNAWAVSGDRTDPGILYAWHFLALPCPKLAALTAFDSGDRLEWRALGFENDNADLYLYTNVGDPLFSPWTQYFTEGPYYGHFEAREIFAWDIPPDVIGDVGFLSSDGSNMSYSPNGQSWFAFGGDPYSLFALDGPQPGPRRDFQMPASSSPGLISADALEGIVVGGGVSATDGNPLSDLWVGVLRYSCYSGFTGPPVCGLCPDCGPHGTCISSAVDTPPCACEAGWNPGTNCQSCLSGIDCNGSSAATKAAFVAILSWSGGCVGAIIVLSCAMYFFFVNRRTARAARAAAEYDVFVSYDHKFGKESAKKITATLREANLRVWLDEDNLRASVLHAMVSGIQASRCVVIFATGNYMTRPNCKVEAEQTLLRVQQDRIPFFLVCEDGFDVFSGVPPSLGSHPVVKLALHNRDAVVRYADTFGSRDWCARALADLQVGRVTTEHMPLSSDALVNSIYQVARKPISIVYLQEHVDQMMAVQSVLEKLSLTANVWAYPPLAFIQSNGISEVETLRPVETAMRSASCVILCLGFDFQKRCASPLHECSIRKARGEHVVFVVAERNYIPALTDVEQPTETKVAAVVGDDKYFPLHSSGTGSWNWTAQLLELEKELLDRLGTSSKMSAGFNLGATTASARALFLPAPGNNVATNVPLLAFNAPKSSYGATSTYS